MYAIQTCVFPTIEEMSSVHESEVATLRTELDQRGLTLPGTTEECVQPRSWVAGLEDELVDLSQRFAALDHTWVEEKAALEASKSRLVVGPMT